MSRTILIIGGGIAGLCAAIALRHAGMQVKVYEKSSGPMPVGAGILIAPNALQALQPYGISGEMIRRGYPGDGFRLLSDRGRDLTRMAIPSDYGSQYSIHRKDLHDLLLTALPSDTVEWGKSFSSLEQNENGVRAAFRDGSQAEGDLLVAADGIYSGVRSQLFPGEPYRYAGYTCWRGVVPADGLDGLTPHFIETWGTQGRFGIVPLPDRRVYWYALINARQSDPRLADYSAADLHRLFQDYHAPIPDLLLRTGTADMIQRDIVDMAPMKCFYSDRVVFVGDAAHAITPNMGQGACQAMEDVRVLSDCLLASPDHSEAFALYQARRQKRIRQISAQSRKIGRVAQSESVLFTRFRNRLMKHVPARLSRRQADQLYRFQT